MVVDRSGKMKMGRNAVSAPVNIIAAAVIAVFMVIMAAALAILIGGEVIRENEQAKLDAVSGQLTVPADTGVSADALTMLPGFDELYRLNNDFCGWISIDGTVVDYPVMNSQYEPEYYLYRAFDRSQAMSGTPFMGQAYSLDTAYAVLYAHNTRDGTMFSILPYYKNEEYYRGHSHVRISNLYEQRDYEVFAACECDLEDTAPAAFRFYQMQPYPTDREFYRMISWFRKNSYYDTGIEPVYGEQIIVLATCSDSGETDRFLVALRKC